MPYKIIFLGSPDFSVPSLEGLYADKRFCISAVFTQPDKKVGRKQILTPSAIKRKALELKLPVYTPKNINTSKNRNLIKKIAPDFLFTIAYGQIVSPEILSLTRIEPVNLHGSLLPKYRGASPLQSCLLHGDEITGITYIRMIEEMDAGEMFWQEKIEIAKQDNAAALFEKIAQLGKKITPDILDKIAQHKLKPKKQNEEQASYCKKISKSNGLIDWKQESATEIYNKIRAYTPWPGCFTYFQGKRLKIIQAFATESKEKNEKSIPSGSVIQRNSQIRIVAKSGCLIPQIVQLEGKKPLPIEDFSKGRPEFMESILNNT